MDKSPMESFLLELIDKDPNKCFNGMVMVEKVGQFPGVVTKTNSEGVYRLKTVEQRKGPDGRVAEIEVDVFFTGESLTALVRPSEKPLVQPVKADIGNIKL